MTTFDKRRELGALQRAVPGDVRPRLLRDRDDVDRRRARRRRALRLRGLPRLAAPGRPADPLRPRLHQDGAGRAAHLRPDARAEVGDRDGRLLVLDGRLQQLRDRAGGQVHAGRRPRAGLPAAARGAHARDPQAAQDDPGDPDRAGASATAPAARRRSSRRRPPSRRPATASGSPARRNGTVPDATGLELLAQELREADAGRSSTRCTSATRRRSSSRRPASPATLERLRGKGFRFMAVHGVDYYPEEPRLGVHYELLDMARSTASR